MRRARCLLFFTLALALPLLSCRPAPGLQAAAAGDRAALGATVLEHERSGDLSNRDAAALAFAVADREVRAAAGPEAVERVRDVWSCARELDDALAERMRMHDDAGAQAALARVDGGGLDIDELRRYLGDPDSRWRAVGTRGLVRPADAAARVRALVDPDPRVRRQAARAARDAADPAELEALAEAARLDPEPIVRTEAVRAIAALLPFPGEAAAFALRDVWASGDEGLREDIALAWASPFAWNAGGRDALRLVVAGDHGPSAVEAAAAVLRHRDAGDVRRPDRREGTDANTDVAVAAVAQLVRSVEQGAGPTRLQAIAQSPLDRPELLEAVTKAAEDADADVRVAALARLAERSAPHAVEKLEGLAQPESPVGARARLALASLGDRRVQAWIENDLRSASAPDRLSAATALAALGLAGRAAPLLADPDASVRLRCACTVLMAARRK
jgi:HEAT repeat protein